MSCDLFDLVKDLLSKQWVGAAALVVGLLVRLSKDDTVLPTVPKRLRSLLSIVLGAASGGLNAVVTGTPWQTALAQGVTAGLVAILGDSLLVSPAVGDVPMPRFLLRKSTIEQAKEESSSTSAPK